MSERFIRWHDAQLELPPVGKIVLVKLEKDNWIYEPDPKKVYLRVMWLDHGLHYKTSNPNNKGAEYMWQEFGPGREFFHEVRYWAHINLPD